jgi:hypothetical protein
LRGTLSKKKSRYKSLLKNGGGLPESLATKGNGGLGVIFGTVFRNGLQDWSEQRRKVLWRDSKGGN